MNPNSERDGTPSSTQGIVSSIATATVGRIPSNAKPPRLNLGGKLTTLLLTAFLFASCGAKKESNTAQPTSGSAPVASETAASSPVTAGTVAPVPAVETQRTTIPGETTDFKPFMAPEADSSEITSENIEVNISQNLTTELDTESVKAIDAEIRSYVETFGANGHSEVSVESMPPQAAGGGTVVELGDPTNSIIKLAPFSIRMLSQGSNLSLAEQTARLVRHSAGHTFVKGEVMAFQPDQEFIMVDPTSGIKVKLVAIQGFSAYPQIILPDGTTKLEKAVTPLEEAAAQLVNRTLTEKAKGQKISEAEFFPEFDSPEYYAMGLFMQRLTDKFFDGDAEAVIQLHQRHGLLPFIAQILGKQTLSGSDVSYFLNSGDNSRIVGYNALVNILKEKHPGKTSVSQEELSEALNDPAAQVTMQTEIEAGINDLLAEIEAYKLAR